MDPAVLPRLATNRSVLGNRKKLGCCISFWRQDDASYSRAVAPWMVWEPASISWCYRLDNEDEEDPIPIIIEDDKGNKIQRKKPIDCQKLVRKAIHMINTKFIPICNGLAGTIDNLVIDGTYEQTTENMPIDMLLIDLSSSGDADEPIEVEVN